MTRPLTVTSPLHPVAVAGYLAVVLVGGLHLLGAARAASIAEWLGPTVANLWAVVLCLGGVLALVGAMVTSRGAELIGLTLEGWASLAIAFASGLYATALVHEDVRAPTTVVVFVCISVGSLTRAGQALAREAPRIQRARANPVTADPAPLGDPDDRR